MARVILYSCETHFFYQTFVAANQNRGNFSRQKLVAEIERLNISTRLTEDRPYERRKCDRNLRRIVVGGTGAVAAWRQSACQCCLNKQRV